MAEDNQDPKADANAGELLDKVLKCVDSLNSRMDAMEAADKARKDAEDESEKAKADAAAEKEREDKAKKDAEGGDPADPERVAADKKRKDAEDEKAKEEAKADAVRRDEEIQKRIADVAAMLPKQRADTDYAAMADAQARADQVFQAFGDSAPGPLNGEDLQGYRLRLASKLKVHSDNLKGVDLGAINDPTAFDVIEGQVYADAAAAALRPADIEPGRLREIIKFDKHTGARTIEFVGSREPGSTTFFSSMKRSGARARILDARKAN